MRPEAGAPAGYRVVYDRGEALAALEVLPETAWMRSDSLATRRAVWAALVECLHPDTGLAIAGQERLAERASVHAGRRIARSTAGNHLRALEAAGVLYVAQTGASRDAIGERDRAPSYHILTPVDAGDDRAPADGGAPDRSGDELGHLPEGSARARTGEITQPHKNADFRSSGTPARREHPERYAARTGPEREIAAAWLAGVMGWSDRSRFAALTNKKLRKITSPFFAAGWSPRAVVWALERRPDGTRWPGPLPTPDQRDSADQPRIHSLGAVLTYRLSAWRDPLGHPLDPPVATERPPRGRPRGTPAAPAPAPPRPRPWPAASDRLPDLVWVRARLAEAAAARDAARAARAAQLGPARSEPVSAPSAQTPAERSALIRRRALLRRRLERKA